MVQVELNASRKKIILYMNKIDFNDTHLMKLSIFSYDLNLIEHLQSILEKKRFMTDDNSQAKMMFSSFRKISMSDF